MTNNILLLFIVLILWQFVCSFHLKGFNRAFSYRSSSANELSCTGANTCVLQSKDTQLDVNLVNEKDMKVPDYPERKLFDQFCDTNSLMKLSLQDITKFEPINNLLDKGYLIKEDYEEFWGNFVSRNAADDEEATDIIGGTVAREEAYEFICMVLDIPDHEQIEHWNKEFDSLYDKAQNMITFDNLCQTADIKSFIDSQELTIEQLYDLCNEITDEFDMKMFTRPQFLRLHQIIDHQLNDDLESSIWMKDFDPKTYFDEKDLFDLEELFNANAVDGRLSKEKFVAWEDLQDLIKEGILNDEAIDSLWNIAAEDSDTIDLDNFLRINIQLELLLNDDDEEGYEDDEEDDV